MRKIIGLILALFLTLSFSMPLNAGQQNKRNKPQQREKYQQNQRPPKYYGQGYRYNHYDQRHYRPNHYRGHWRSWREWDDHRRHNSHSYKNGRYYRENNNLYFEFETEDGRFVFSIGK